MQHGNALVVELISSFPNFLISSLCFRIFSSHLRFRIFLSQLVPVALSADRCGRYSGEYMKGLQHPTRIFRLVSHVIRNTSKHYSSVDPKHERPKMGRPWFYLTRCVSRSCFVNFPKRKFPNTNSQTQFPNTSSQAQIPKQKQPKQQFPSKSSQAKEGQDM